MRIAAQAGGISVHAISGTNSVLLGMDAEPNARTSLLGFAIRVMNLDDGQGGWLRGFKFFEELIPNPQPGERRSTLEHPIQSFLWGHYSAKPNTAYRYTVRPLYGTPSNLRAGDDVIVDIRTEDNEQGLHGIYFNRGAIPSQAFADKFGNRAPLNQNDPTAADVQWLSRGLLDAALRFIGQARGSRFQLQVAAYEFTYPPIMQALIDAAASGAFVSVVYEAGTKTAQGVISDTSTTVQNNKAILDANIAAQPNIRLIPRHNRRNIPHNKFIILLENSHPIQVWTGSTNFTPSGFLGQSNVGHIIRDESIAAIYQTYWEELATDPLIESFQDWNSANSPNPGDELPVGITPIFSPRNRSRMLNWYGDRIEQAQQTVMLTAAFGVTRKLAERFNNDKDYLRFLMMERRNRSDETQAMLERDRDTIIALGSALNRNTIQLELDGHRLDEWFLREQHYRWRGYVFYVHTKYMMVDVLTDDPLVFTGSANFSPNSILSNDENMLLIRGNTAVADIYLNEFFRLFNHFYFRYIAIKLAQEQQGNATRAAYLDPTDTWVARHFETWRYHSKRRELFRV